MHLKMTTPDPLDLLICSTCGTQFSNPSSQNESLTSCKICDDPRQYVPPTGQAWTTLRTLQTSTNPSYKNIFTPDPIHGNALIAIHTEPRVAIGQRAYLCLTAGTSSLSSGGEEEDDEDEDGGERPFNILWDCITYIDEETIARIKSLGGIHAIVISHPHYYTTNLVWAEAFGCPVYLSREDEEWVCVRGERQVLFEEGVLGLSRGLVSKGTTSRRDMEGNGNGDADLVVIKTGGHFPGSTVVWWKSLRTLLIADTIAVIPSGRYWVNRPPGTASFTFMWSYPNMIPLSADDVHGIWKAIKHTEFDITRGAFIGMDTDTDSKKRLLDSAKIFVKAMGYLEHAIHQEECL